MPPIVPHPLAPRRRSCHNAAMSHAWSLSELVVREVPALLGDCDVRGLVRDLADELEQLGEAIALRQRLGDICATMACHGSVRAGRRLNALKSVHRAPSS